MIFSDDSDLQRIQPYVFEHGVDSFTEYHEQAAADVIADLRLRWWPNLRTPYPYGGIGSLLVDGSSEYGLYAGVTPVWNNYPDFDSEKLNPVQWVPASTTRVLGWYVLPRLAASVGGSGLVEMMRFYRGEYEREFLKTLTIGVEYDTGYGFVRVDMRPVSERQRLRR
ncbi:hypothetical protein G9409_08245 [Chlorobium sp. BLA1]|uniref:hypothetical protein n=1 Tax=Candidatus Chlorobium masyuteum TaxID=2716876 RepID=UPI0014240482|nr:hypothetical protein [Candidatus Chlorobium masyuteum]NHQ60576.1 hypothetical protein [Candidatus Chlorobium masyuteum]